MSFRARGRPRTLLLPVPAGASDPRSAVGDQTAQGWVLAAVRSTSQHERLLRVEVERDDLSGSEIVVRRAGGDGPAHELLVAVAEHLKNAAQHPAGSTDWLVEPDRKHPY